MHGQFFWYDLMATDTGAAAKFYNAIVGWDTSDSGSPGYTAFTVDDYAVAGLMDVPEEARKAGATSFWMGYIHVDNVADMATRITTEGGALHKGPIEIPDVIRFAVVSDPQGAPFIIANPLMSDMPPLPKGKAGTIGWHELYAADQISAFAFYEKLFGWKKKDAINMGDMGLYQLFATGGEDAVGGMMTKLPDMPKPYWTYYFNVDGIYAALERVTRNGGKPLMGPHQVPTGQWILQALDPQGAPFALVSETR